MKSKSQRGVLRQEHGEQHRVTYAELFFDLVFVFAVTQLSHALLNHLSARGALEALVLFMAVWWAWMDTAWVTNWINPNRAPARLMMLALMLVGLVVSASLPTAFGDGAVAFAVAYAVFQCGRSAFVAVVLRGEDRALQRNFYRILAWNILTGAVWIGGALAGDGSRLGLWLLAIALDNFAPLIGFWTPFLGRSSTRDWDVEGGHMAERCGLFLIIALGESILVTGSTFAEMPWQWDNVAAFVVAFLGSVAMWWIYFDTGVERGSERIVKSRDPGKLARFTYTYVHQIIVIGVIICAVADELVLAHPGEPVHLSSGLVVIGGPMLYVLGNGIFKRPLLNHFPLSHLMGLVLLVLASMIAPFVSVLALAGTTTSILIVVAIWETIALQHLRRGIDSTVEPIKTD